MGRSNLYENPLKSILLISKKHNLDPELLVDSFVEAWKNQSCECDGFFVSCRTINRESVNFLITKDDKVISQFPINIEVLNTPDFLKRYIKNNQTQRHKKVVDEKKIHKIIDLRYGLKKVNLKAKIIEMPPSRHIITRWGAPSYVSNIMISDETGNIRLSLWNNQIEQFNVGDEVELKNCYVARFSGEPQLRLGKKGSISLIK